MCPPLPRKARLARPDAPSSSALYYSYHDCTKTGSRCLDAEDTDDPHGLSHIHFRHFYSLFRTRHFILPLYPLPPPSILLPPSATTVIGRHHPPSTATPRASSPRMSRCCAARQRRLTDGARRRTVDEPALDCGAHGLACSGRTDATRHKTAGLGSRLRVPSDVCCLAPCAHFLVFLRTLASVVCPSFPLAIPRRARRTQ